MLVLIRNGEVYGPEIQGRKDVLLCAGKIALTPGFVDPHTHPTGGSGEEGFASRTPELQLSEIVPWGITTVVGCLGLDATTRTLEGLVAKVRGRRHGGCLAERRRSPARTASRPASGSRR